MFEFVQTADGVVGSLWVRNRFCWDQILESDPKEYLWEALKNLREKYVRSVAKIDMKVKCGDFSKGATIIQVLTDMVVTSSGHGRVEPWNFSEITWIEGMDEVFPKH
jgi:hypothetical protein